MTRFVHVLYCDDVRHEIGGKRTFVGAYNGALLLDAIPGLLPKLCVVVTAYTPVDQPFKGLSARVFFDEQQLANIELEPDALNQATQAALQNADSTARFVSLQTQFVFVPFAVETQGVLRVVVQTESEELISAGLLIRKVDPN